MVAGCPGTKHVKVLLLHLVSVVMVSDREVTTDHPKHSAHETEFSINPVNHRFILMCKPFVVMVT
uniref:Secreted protein n=1 Tax=Rhizophora mucronata TaxID=61149 RepID=A0A2P2K3S3_RHIMU